MYYTVEYNLYFMLNYIIIIDDKSYFLLTINYCNGIKIM